jgi:hypothetical protein
MSPSRVKRRKKRTVSNLSNRSSLGPVPPPSPPDMRLYTLIFSCPFFACRNFSFRSRGGSHTAWLTAAGLKSSSSCVYERDITSSYPTLFFLFLCPNFLYLSLFHSSSYDALSLSNSFHSPVFLRPLLYYFTFFLSFCPFLLRKSLGCLLYVTFQPFFRPKS